MTASLRLAPALRLAHPPEPPELPAAARPAWPPWYAPAALVASLAALVVGIFPVLPALLFLDTSGALGAFGLLTLIIVQDLFMVVSGLAFANMKLPPRPWHFGFRGAPWRRTASWAVAGFALMFGFELGYLELLGTDESNADDLGAEEGALAALLVYLAVIVVAPVTEEIFFRGFFYRALRTRLRLWSAAIINGVVFASLHFEGADTAGILPVIAVFGVGQCLVYERTGSIYAVIAIHAAFNTVASLQSNPGIAVAVGVVVIAACAAAALRTAPAPSPFGEDPRRRGLPA
jgi:membrane protease YdiL (CAAX protease family)